MGKKPVVAMGIHRLLAIAICISACSPTTATTIWPPPQSIVISGPVRTLDLSFKFSSAIASPILTAAFERHSSILQRRPAANPAAAQVPCPTDRCGAKADPPNDCIGAPAAYCTTHCFGGCEHCCANTSTALGGARGLEGVIVLISANTTGTLHDAPLNIDTDYSYSLSIDAGETEGVITARSVYGALYGLESFSQLAAAGALPGADIQITDAPQYSWRGLMIDAGRRFFPVPLVRNLLDTMAAVKLNVLHLHASDHCRFSVESKLFPELTAALTGDQAGFYTQQDIKDLQKYAKARGIRVVPEFDIPGHARGMLPLEKRGLQFCTADASRSQLYNDPSNATFNVLEQLLGEMAALFDDEVFNIGADETAAKGVCTVESSFGIERKMIETIKSKYGKTPEGWEEIFFDAGAATMDTIVNAWARHNASSITSTGRRAVESASDHFYFTGAGPGGPAGWDKCHYDIGTGVPIAQRKLLLGGEISMWSDTYCGTAQCGSSSGPPPVAHKLFPPSADAKFSQSIGGMIWPRGYVAAGAFWNFNATEDPSSQDFQDRIYKLNDDLASRGSFVCPSHCSCDQLAACGKPY